ncbi:MAG: polysaccharide biosynthesis protein [Lachnospiraceae bacterium]|nr:polysaccharide biosynthesis protein [Lachnospiraceae bacterium]
MEGHGGAPSRVRAAGINILFGYAGTVITALLSFILRKIFILHLDGTLLGVNGLYTGILSMLSMAELGVGTAFQFALYRPVAEKETETVKSYMAMYARVYRVVAAAIALLGLALTPFLPVLIRNPGSHSVRDLTLYYFIFLFNTVSTYFVSYKYALANAEQRNYIQTNVVTLTKFVTVLLQIAVLVLTENFYAFLLTDALVQLAQKIVVSVWMNHRYPLLRDRDVKPLDQTKRMEVWTKTRSLLMHRIGDALRLQTDAMLISAFIEVAAVGLVDNYLLVVNTIANFVNIIFNSVISGFGNLIATEEEEKQHAMFRVYRFFAAYAYGFSFVGFFVLLTPLISLLFGAEWVLPALAVQLFLLDYYFKGERVVLSNYKTAAGVFEPDRYLALLQGLVNLVISVALVRPLGLAGIYVGTLVSGLIANVTKPVIIYRSCFDGLSLKQYYLDNVKYMAVTGAALVLSVFLRGLLMPGAMTGGRISVPFFVLTAAVITVIFHVLFFLCFGRTKECGYLVELIRRRVRR